jgi:hypothetical protein
MAVCRLAALPSRQPPRKQESPTDRISPACSGFPTSSDRSRLERPKSYLGAEELELGVIAELLLLPSAGAAGVVLLSDVAAGGVAAGGGAGAAGGGVLSVLLQAVSTSAAAMALRASFVFIDESPKLFERRSELVKRNTHIGRIRLPYERFYRVSSPFETSLGAQAACVNLSLTEGSP